MSDPPALPARIGHYEVTAVLGRGAMSTVYRATDARSRAMVALKLAHLSPGLRDEMPRRFEHEAAIGRCIDHPRVIRILDSGTHKGAPYLAMELIDGPTLMALLEHGPLLAAYAAAVVARLAETLADLHRDGIIHRDVKPQNVMLRRPLDPVLTDFGVAYCAKIGDVRADELSGTPASMAPEQITGATLDGRTDVFALGILLYRLVTGRRPFDGSATEVADQILHADPVPATRLAPRLPHAIDRILEGALAKDPARRYTAASLAEELRTLTAAVAGGPAIVPPPRSTALPGSRRRS